MDGDRLRDHRALVTGGGAGIGAAICRRFVAEGARVAVIDRDAERAEAVAASLGDAAFALSCDVADAAAVNSTTSQAVDRLGGLTDLVNNAGMGRNKPLHTYTDKEWQLVIGVNLTGAFHCLRAAIPHLLDRGGSVVNMASLNATRPLPGEAPYSAAKAALVNLTMTAALEYAPAVRVNCVSPGLIDTALTEMVTSNDDWRSVAESGTPLGRVGRADEVAATVAWLASEEASYVTGQNIVIDGGSGLPNLQAEGIVRAISSSFAT